MKYLYKYPQRAYPYEELVRENQNRSRDETEFEILDTDAFAEDRYWDVFVEVKPHPLIFALRTIALTMMPTSTPRTRTTPTAS
jgi:hypothetical protein